MVPSLQTCSRTSPPAWKDGQPPRLPLLRLCRPYHVPAGWPLTALVAEFGTALVALSGAANVALPGNADALLGIDRRRFAECLSQPVRTRLVASRWLLRTCAGAVLGIRPDLVPLYRDPAGRPRLPAQTGVDVNLSHTGDALLVGVTTRGTVGVDVEAAGRSLSALGIEGAMCGPGERARLHGLPPAQRDEMLLRLWTLKEAYGKALGVGLGVAFTSVEFQFAGDFASPAAEPGPGLHEGWSFRSICFPAGHWSAVAVGPSESRHRHA